MLLLQYFDELTLQPQNAKKLKGLILELAVRGKLTKNWRTENPNTESANQLLAEIKAEKKRLIAEKVIKKESALPKIEAEEIPFELPENWVWSRLINLSSINGGYAFKSSDYISEGARVIRISDFDENGFKNHKVVRHSYTANLASYVLEEKNILMAMTGGTVGKSLFIKKIEELMVVNQRVAMIKLSNYTLEEFIYFVIRSKMTQDVVNEAKNSTNDNISMSNIKSFIIPLPPLSEQKAIVKIVEQLFEEVEILERLTGERLVIKQNYTTAILNRLANENTEATWQQLLPQFEQFFDTEKSIKALRQTILQLAVQGKLTKDWRKANPNTSSATELLQQIKTEKKCLIAEKVIKKEKVLPKITKEEIPFELPESWVWCRFQSIFKDLRYGTSKKCGYDLGNTPVLRIPNVSKGKLDVSDIKSTDFSSREKKDLELNLGDLLIIRSNGSSNLVGRSAVVTEEGFSFAGYLVRVRNFDDKINAGYLHLNLESSSTRKAIEVPLRTTSGVKNINSTEISKLLVPFPPLSEQKAIVEKVATLLGYCDALEAAIAERGKRVEALMDGSLSGILGV
jgi:type I restriction enzyme S subunit